jgi:hypothetical protein
VLQTGRTAQAGRQVLQLNNLTPQVLHAGRRHVLQVLQVLQLE